MAFISYTEHRGEGRKSSGIKVMPPFVRFRKGKGSVVSAGLNKAAPLCGKAIFAEVGDRRIWLTQGEDGWWYRSYSEED